MSAGHVTAAAREERAEIDMLRQEADRVAADAARTLAELTGRLTPRNIAARLGGKPAVRIAAAAIPVAAALAAAAAAAARGKANNRAHGGQRPHHEQHKRNAIPLFGPRGPRPGARRPGRTARRRPHRPARQA